MSCFEVVLVPNTTCKKSIKILKGVIVQKIDKLNISQKQFDNAKRLADVGTFSAVMAHELKNPLGVIKIAVYNLRKKSKDAELAVHLDTIDKKVLESDMIIKKLSSYSKIRTPNYENVQIIRILQACIEDTKNKRTDYQIRLNYKCNCKDDFTIEADSAQLVELIDNIIDNAYLAYSDKKGSVDIEIDCNEEANKINMVFRDYGVGMEEETLSKINEPFFTTRAKGVGLGMTVCFQVASLHKGTIDVKSKKGEGTTIYVSLPIRRV